ncbi:MAG: hypothetical protein JWQ09_4546 [Segetibacter sp.]|nr:hypothetical protein [Segetibacter sp.]
MLKDFDKTISTPSDFSIPKGKGVDIIFDFLDKILPGFTNDLKAGLTHEDDISQECAIYLNREARNSLFMFHFQHKYPGKNRSSDFSIISAERFSSKDPLLVLEAKRLPTPGKSRAREYVQGNLGAIERFKRGYHGNKLIRSAILGYIQKENFNYWYKEVCTWINDLIKTNKDSTITWNEIDLLQYVGSLKGMNKYSSRHFRSEQEDIKLTHYWMNVN